ncbi:hypothetical protein O7627_15220 [Solwaraspora sp. WMMD1047]|nr:hypothetical protein [Solwaraspora sp. WMMD1047]MDG4830643.1 hypothetical protein [Solwaraspora sp. WMMD1047]
MDVAAACRAFLAVSGHGSFTSGAAAAGIPESVARRRVAGRTPGSNCASRTIR